MKRFRAFALAGLLALPVSAAAQDVIPPGQTGRQLPQSRYAITPFVGVRVPYSTGDEFLFREGDGVSGIRVTQERGGSLAVGADAEYRVRGPWSLVGGVAYTPGSNDVARIRQEGQNDRTFSSDGADMLFAKAGVSFRLPEPNPDARRFHPAGFLVAAPTLIRMSPAVGDASNHLGLNLGLQATAPLGRSRRLAFQLAIDDYVAFWDTEALAESDQIRYSALLEEPVVIDYDYGISNILVIRLGASFRM